MLYTKSSNIELHTWGDENEPDVVISKFISKKYNLFLTRFNLAFTKNIDKLVEQAKKHTLNGNLVLSALASQELIGRYSKLDTSNSVVIDGGYGLLTRRGNYNRIAVFGRKALLNANLPELMKYVSLNRGDIFFDEVENKLKQYREEIFINFYNSMPNPQKIGVENWIDLMYIRTKTPNLAAVNQNYMDSLCENYMPFAQPDILNLLLSIPVYLKKNSMINKAIFAKFAPDLTKIPMEEYGFIIPFGYNHYRDYIYKKFISILKKPYQNQQRYQILYTLKEYFFDIVESDIVRNSNIIDQNKIRKILHKYYNKNEKSYADTIGWWFTFNIWDEWKNRI
ncbi:MAG: hypothetical protein K8S23_05785 [Candidatus Cloacimonetes bacterium]|nr:hypothetical protein [Candidatus Cloacimonadota bacterium]